MHNLSTQVLELSNFCTLYHKRKAAIAEQFYQKMVAEDRQAFGQTFSSAGKKDIKIKETPRPEKSIRKSVAISPRGSSLESQIEKTILRSKTSLHNLNMTNMLSRHRSLHDLGKKEEANDYTIYLMSVPVLAKLKKEELQKINDECEQETFSNGETIVSEGDTQCDNFYIILEGQVKVLKYNAELLKDEEVGRLGQTECFGERALLTNEPRSASCVADGWVRLLVLTKEVFERTISDQAHLIGTLYSVKDESGAFESARICKQLLKMPDDGNKCTSR